MGTRGDVQPYIFLSQALKKNGISVTLGSHPCWRQLVEDAGICFVPIGPDIDIEYEASVIRGKEKNPMMAMLKTMKFVFRIVEQSSKEVYQYSEGMDLMIVSHSHIGAAEAEALHMKTIDVTLQTEAIGEPKKPVSPLKRFTNNLIWGLLNPVMMKPYNRLRKEYGLKKAKSMDQIASKSLNLIPISQYVIEKNPYWDDQNQLVGYWYDEDPKDYVPSQHLKDFLEAGEAPYILALGAMSFEAVEEKQKLDIFIQAFSKTGKRAVIQGFKKSLEDYNLPDTMIAVDAIPHSWLFKRGACVIHHGGFGTSASAMLYGAPSIVIPHALDQFGMAERLYKLGVAAKPLKAAALSLETLVDQIHYIDHNYETLSNCVKDLSERMSQEHGLDTAVAMIQNILNVGDKIESNK